MILGTCERAVHRSFGVANVVAYADFDQIDGAVIAHLREQRT